MKSKNPFMSSFFDSSKSIYFLLIVILFFHLFWAWQWPILNDESYYWDWGRNIQLSYVDAPPAISWLSYFSSKIFHGNLGVRLFVPFFNFFTALFLIKSTHILNKKKSDTNINSLVAVILFASIPIFNINGTLLMPDAPLLLFCAGSLYFALKSCENFVYQKTLKLSLINACLLGIFIGLSIDSKYQAIPLSVSIFLAITCIRGLKNTLKRDMLFWMITIIFALLISSPLWLWNLKNNFASFKFQGQHGFSMWRLNLKIFFLYMVSVFSIFLPWFSYLFIKQFIHSIKKKHFLHSLDCIPIFSCLSIFIFIGTTSLGGELTQVHWITPSAIFLIPLVAANWKKLTSKHVMFWKNITICSFIIMIITASVVFTRPIQNFISQDKRILGYRISNMHRGLYGNLIWANMKNPTQNFKKNINQIFDTDKKYFYDLDHTKCTKEPYLASFSWRWASQLAFHLKNQPRVFAFHLNHATYYSWRDNLADLAGCRVLIVGPKNMYKPYKIEKLMSIVSVSDFEMTKDFTNHKMKMVLIEGIMKDQKTLNKISNNIIQNIKY